MPASERPRPGARRLRHPAGARGVPVDLERHVDRLARSVRELYGVPVDAAGLAARHRRRRRRGLGRRGCARRTTRGAGSGRSTATRIEVPGLEPRTLTLRRVPGGLGRPQVDRPSARRRPRRGDDVLLVDEHDLVLECGSANVFVVLGGRGGHAAAGRPDPAGDRAGPGPRPAARRRHVERRVTLAELAGAAEVFTTSSIRGVQPVVACSGSDLGGGAVPTSGGGCDPGVARSEASPGKLSGKVFRPKDLSLNCLSGHDLGSEPRASPGNRGEVRADGGPLPPGGTAGATAPARILERGRLTFQGLCGPSRSRRRIPR